MLKKRELETYCGQFEYLLGKYIQEFWDIELERVGCGFVLKFNSGEVLFGCYDGSEFALNVKLSFCKKECMAITKIEHMISASRNEYMIKLDFSGYVNVLIPLGIPVI